MSSWKELREELRRLWESSPTVLNGSPDPDSWRPSQGKCEIEVAAHAEQVAADLHARYPDLVKLRVGLLKYPKARPVGPMAISEPSGRPGAIEHGLTVALADPTTPPQIGSGFSGHVDLVVSNDSDRERHLHTNGVLQSYVVDASGTVVGCFHGLQHLPLQVFTVPPGGSMAVPALVGTASLTPDLGYAIPPGSWHFVVELTLGAGLDSPSHRETVVWSEPLALEVAHAG